MDHDILLRKFLSLGIRSDLLGRVQSYLSNRCQAVVLGVYKSEYIYKCINIPSGVPQGSQLGPLFYGAHIYDLDKCFSHADYLLYANDKKILFLRVDYITDCERLKFDLNKVFAYYRHNNI